MNAREMAFEDRRLRVGICALEINAKNAELARELAGVEADGGWREDGVGSFVDWVMRETGFDRHVAESLVRSSQTMRALPVVARAFSAGELSLEKVRSLSTVATPDDQESWTLRAREASASQLARMCREHHSRTIDSVERDREQRRRRHLNSFFDELGMLQVHGALPPDDGIMVRDALERLGRRIAAERSGTIGDSADDPAAALRADALVHICAGALIGEGGPVMARPAQLIVHVDAAVLTGQTSEGRCHLEDGPAISREMARRLGCDATVITMLERDGSPVGEARVQRVPDAATLRSVRSRDQVCRYPGCSVAASRCVAHHVRFWSDGGPSTTWNLVSLCHRYHHNRLHDGEFHILRTADGDLEFRLPNGKLIGTATGGHWRWPVGQPAPP